jgi:hypothetical protein
MVIPVQSLPILLIDRRGTNAKVNPVEKTPKTPAQNNNNPRSQDGSQKKNPSCRITRTDTK